MGVKECTFQLYLTCNRATIEKLLQLTNLDTERVNMAALGTSNAHHLPTISRDFGIKGSFRKIRTDHNRHLIFVT